MKNDVKINIPLFLGLILLVAAVSAILVSGVRMVSDYIIEKNMEAYKTFEQFEELLNGDNMVNETENSISTRNYIDFYLT